MKQSELDEAKILDAALEKFRGNITYREPDVVAEDWYSNFTDNVYHSENAIKTLIGDGLLIRFYYQPIDDYGHLKLSDKGWSVLANIERKGYVAQYNKKNRNKRWTYISGLLVVLTFFLVLRRDFIIRHQSPSGQESKPEMAPINNDTIIKTDSTSNQIPKTLNDTTKTNNERRP